MKKLQFFIEGYISKRKVTKMKPILIMSLLLLLFSCDFDIAGISDSEAELPEISTTGEDTFGCKINGKVFAPDFESFMSDQSLYANIFRNEIDISAFNNQKWRSRGTGCNNTIVSIIFNKNKIGKIKDTAYISFIKCIEENENGDTRLSYNAKLIKNSNTDNSFEVLKFDTVSQNKIVFSCKFSAIVENEAGETKKITDGRFDVNLD